MKAKHIIMGLTAASGCVALLLQFPLTIFHARRKGTPTTKAVVNYFSFFTELTNILITQGLTSSLYAPRSRWGRFFARYDVKAALALYITITAVVYWTILRKPWQKDVLQRVSDDILHGVVPGFYITYWLIWPSKIPLSWNVIPLWLVYPLGYLLYTLVRGTRVNWYPYHFLDAHAIGYGRVFRNAALLVIAFSGTGALLVGVSRYGADGET